MIKYLTQGSKEILGLDENVYNVVKNNLSKYAKDFFGDSSKFLFTFKAKLNLNQALVSYEAQFDNKSFSGVFVIDTKSPTSLFNEFGKMLKKYVLEKFHEIQNLASKSIKEAEDKALENLNKLKNDYNNALADVKKTLEDIAAMDQIKQESIDFRKNIWREKEKFENGAYATAIKLRDDLMEPFEEYNKWCRKTYPLKNKC